MANSPASKCSAVNYLDVDLEQEEQLVEEGRVEETWHEKAAGPKNLSPEQFMEELCVDAGGYRGFFRSLLRHYFGWWTAVMVLPALFASHHMCDAERPPLSAWLLYGTVVLAMVSVAVNAEVSLMKKLGFMAEDDHCAKLLTQWRLPLVATLLWKLSAYTDMVFVFVAKDCGSSLWMPSFATFIFGVVFAQLILNTCFAVSDCDKELPTSFGFVLLDFKLLNAGLRRALPFDPDASDLPIGRPVTLRGASQLVKVQKIVVEIAQVSIQMLFLRSTGYDNGLVICSVVLSLLNGALSLSTALKNWVEDEYAVQAQSVQQGVSLQPAPKILDPEEEVEMHVLKTPTKEIMPSVPAEAIGLAASPSRRNSEKSSSNV